MALFKFFKNKQEHANTIEYRKILKERDAFKEKIKKNLMKMDFTDEEVGEVLFIIEKSYKQVEKAKQPLINVTANDILNEVEDKVKKDIQDISNRMLDELRQKIVEINARKSR